MKWYLICCLFLYKLSDRYQGKTFSQASGERITHPWHLAGDEATVPLRKVREPETDREALLSDAYGLQHARVTQLLQDTRHVQLKGSLLGVGLDAANKPGIAPVVEMMG